MNTCPWYINWINEVNWNQVIHTFIANTLGYGHWKYCNAISGLYATYIKTFARPTHTNKQNQLGHMGAIFMYFSPTAISHWTYQFSSDHWSQAMLSPVSTWMGDRLGTLGVVGIFFVFDPTTILHDMKEEVDGRHPFRIIR